MNTIIYIIQRCFLRTLAMISDGCNDWNPAKHVAHVTNSLDTYPRYLLDFKYLINDQTSKHTIRTIV